MLQSSRRSYTSEQLKYWDNYRLQALDSNGSDVGRALVENVRAVEAKIQI